MPDNLTINNAKEKIIELSSSKELSKIYLTTIEDLASKIIILAQGRTPRLLSDEIRNIILADVISEMARGKKDNISSKIWGIISKESPENHELLKEISNEFSEFIGCINALPSTKESEPYLNTLINVSKKLPDNYSRENTVNALNFYRDLVLRIEEKLKKLSIDDYYSRTHLVKEASNELVNNKEKILGSFNQETHIWVSGISVFDTSAFVILTELANTFGDLRINAGELTLQRLDRRLKFSKNIKADISFIKGCTPGYSKYDMFEVPDLRREVETVALEASKLCDNGYKPEDIVVIARDIGLYLPYVEKVVKDYGLASHVQTRRSLSLTPAYRLISSILELLALVEKNEPIPGRAITDPLRLGFRRYKPQWSKDFRVDAFYDKKFLWIESLTGFASHSEDLKWAEWKKALAKYGDSGIFEIIEWVDKHIGKPSIDPIESVIKNFAKSCVDWASPLRLSNGFPYDRFEVCSPHITSQSGWLHSLVERLNQYSDIYTRIRGEGKTQTWEDIKYGFYAIAGSETFGIQLKDANAIRFVDAGISHFIDGKIRFILGLKSEGFPRKCPRPFLLKNEFRRLVNELESILYLRDPTTDYENELDFFNTALGPKPDKEKIILTMPYLDDRGHKEEWSIFVKKNGEIYRVKVSDIFQGKESTTAPIAYWRGLVLDTRGEDGIAKCFNELVDPRWKTVANQEICPRLDAIESRIINRDGAINVDKNEKYLNSFIKSVESDLIPAHELDLFYECPAMYYFYRFLYGISPFTLKDKKGLRTYIPEWKTDFTLGPIPSPIRRHYISTEMQEALGNILAKYTTTQALNSNKTAIKNEIDRNYKLEYYSRKRLLDFLDYIVADADSGSKIVFKNSGKTDLDALLWRPAYVFYRGGERHGNRFVFFARTGPRTAKEPCILQYRHWKSVECPGARYKYKKVEDGTYERLKSEIKTLHYQFSGRNNGACDSCVYATLCGEWGFM